MHLTLPSETSDVWDEKAFEIALVESESQFRSLVGWRCDEKHTRDRASISALQASEMYSNLE